MDDYGDFEEVTDGVQQQGEQGGEAPARAKLPARDELLGSIVQRYGGNRMEVLCSDGKSRNCRVPGRFRRSLWLRPGDIVIVKPWVDDDYKADIVYKYSSAAINQLKKKGLLGFLKSDF